jgi:alpha-beta hydrolase superfamily lysophospholipase
MQHFEYQWDSADGISFYGQGWLPEGEPKAAVALVHGLGEHSSRYQHVGEALTRAKYALISFDLRGHGKSSGQRGHLPAFEAFMQDIDHLLAEAAQRFSGKPRFLYGHSLGGILVLNYALRRKPDLAGVVATSAGLRTALERQTAKVAFVKILGSLFPSLGMRSGLDPQTISRDPAVVQAYIHDPLAHDLATPAFGKNMLAAIRWAYAHASEFPVPLLIMHGTADLLAFSHGSQEFAALVPRDCTLKLWDGLYHETHNDPEKDQVLAYLVGWFDQMLERQNAAAIS